MHHSSCLVQPEQTESVEYLDSDGRPVKFLVLILSCGLNGKFSPNELAQSHQLDLTWNWQQRICMFNLFWVKSSGFWERRDRSSACSHSGRRWLHTARYGCAVCCVSAAGRAALMCDTPPGACCRQDLGAGLLRCSSVLVSYVRHSRRGLWKMSSAGNKVVQLAKQVELPFGCFSLHSKVTQWRDCNSESVWGLKATLLGQDR